jgi:hypothetical protein
MNRRSGGTSLSSRSIVCSRRSTSASLTAAFVTRLAMRADGSARRSRGRRDPSESAPAPPTRPPHASRATAPRQRSTRPPRRSVNPRVGLGDPRVVKERRLASIAGLCVNLHDA